MEGVKGQCFICERRVNNHSATTDGGEDAELETAVFVLRKVLQAPTSLVETFLKETPSDCGLGVCKDCRPLLAECRAVHEDLCQVKRKWSDVKTKVVNQIKVTAAPEEEDGSRGIEDIRRETRRFVMNQLNAVVNESNPFPSGQDLQRRAVSEETEEGESETSFANQFVAEEEDANDDGDAEVAPPPKKALIPRRNSQKLKIKTRAERQPIASQRTTKSYDCLFCSAKLRDLFRLEKHLRVHTRERPFWCGVCGQECSSNENLTRHQRTHTGEKPHQCKLCRKRFAQSSTLKNHVRAHLGERAWKCPDCRKAFVQKGNLTAHRRVVHTGEKPFQCRVCGKRFSRGYDLTRHKKRRHSAVVKVKSKK